VTRSRWRRVAAALAAVLAIAAGFYLVRAAAILAAYKAKMLCSEVFLAGRDPAAVERELEVNDLQALRVVADSIDHRARRVTSSVAGFVVRDAVSAGDRGCTLAPDPATHPGESTPRSGGTLRVALDDRLRAVIDRAFTEPQPGRPRLTRAIVAVRDGLIVGERYAPGFTADTPLLGWSMTKTMMNALVGVLVREGRLQLDRPVPIPEWQDAGDPRRAITLDHLLRMSSGLEFDESAWNPVSDVTVMLLAAPDAGRYAASKRSVAAPGTVWQYSSGTTNIISRAIRIAIGEAEYARLPRRALFDPLQMSSAVIETDPSGTFVGSSFGYATARDWARLGMLYVNDGVWDGARILPEGWVAYTRTPAPADPLQRYGAHVWLKVAEAYSGDAVLPTDTFHATGHAGQFVTMIPSERLVVVRLGLTRYAGAWDQTGFVRDVINALGTTGTAGERPSHEDTRAWH